MKRMIAGLLVLLSLLSVLPGALAAGPEASNQSAVTGQAPAETPAADPAKTADGTETEGKPAETPAETPTETESAPEGEAPADGKAPAQTPAGPDMQSLSSETAITRMEIRLRVENDGYAVVTQHVEMQMIGAPEEIRFSFPEGAKKCEIAGYRTKSSTEKGLKYLTIKNRKGFTGTQTFQLSYTINCDIAGGEASQILNLPILSLQDYKIGYLIFQVTMPSNFTSKPYFASGYYGDLVRDIMDVAVEDNVITGLVKQIVRDNDTLAMTLVLPEKYFKGSYGESRLSPIMTIVVLLLLTGSVIYWFMTLRNDSLRITARTLPPDGVTPGDLPFLLAGGNVDFNMLVTHWATLGYLSFYVNKGGNIILRRRMEMGNERRAFERKLFDMLFGTSDVCDGASLRYKKVGAKAMQVIPHYWGKRLYDKRSGSVGLLRGACYLACAMAMFLAMDAVAPTKAHILYLILGLVAGGAMAVAVIHAFSAYYLNDWLWMGIGMGCALLLLVVGGLGGATYVMLPAVVVTMFVGWQTVHGGLRRTYGDEVISQSLGFRRFLRSATEANMMQMQRRDPQYFYKILPYAEAMGQGHKFAALFGNCKLEPCQWFESARETTTNAQTFYNRYADMLDLLNISLKK